MRHAGIVLLVLACFTLLSGVPAAATEKRVALVIGNTGYQHVPALANTANDARLVARTLQGLGFQLVGGGVQLDLDNTALKKAIGAFGKLAESSDVALFYYAGHGLQMRDSNFLVPIDADPVKPSDVDLQLVDARIVLDEMQDSGASLKLLILDACRNNPFGGRGLRDINHGLVQMSAPRGTVISYSTQPGNVASDGAPGANSPFSLALAEALGRPGIDVLEMFNEVGLTVDRATNGEQQPWVASSPIQGRFFFAGKPTEQTLDQETLYWQSVMNSANVSDYRAYLDHFPNGVYATLAQARLAALTAPPPEHATTRAPPSNPQRAALESRVLVPTPLALAVPTGAPSDAFLGEWYGISSVGGGRSGPTGQVIGREIIFAIQSVAGTRVVAMFGYGPFQNLQAQAAMRVGTLEANEIDFPANGAAPRVIVTTASTNSLQVATTQGTSATAIALMRRIDR